MKTTFEVREIDAWNSPNGWYWNSSYFIGTFTTIAATEEGIKRSFVRYLNKKGIHFKLNRTIIENQIDVFEIQDRKTKEPLFAAIWKEE